MDTQLIESLAGPAVTIITLLVNQWAIALKAKREADAKAAQVKADLDRERLEIASKMAMRVAELDAENKRRFAITTEKLDQNHESIKRVNRAITENTDISIRAFDATNHVNEKIAAVPEKIMEILAKHGKIENHEKEDTIEPGDE